MTTLKNKIKDVYQQAAANQWSYPQFFNGLKSAGVRSYTMDVLKHTIEFTGDQETHLEPGPADWNLTAGAFNKEAVIKAVRRVQQRETDYPAFLKEIAAAGIPKYYVSMTDNTVSYLGADPNNKYVEQVPSV